MNTRNSIYCLIHLVLGLAIFSSVIAQTVSRDVFTISYENGLTDYIVLETKGLTAKDEYLRTIDWIKHNYNIPEEVIKSKIENEYLIMRGVAKNIYSWRDTFSPFREFHDIRYQIEFNFEDGRIKLCVIDLETYANYSPSHNDLPLPRWFQKEIFRSWHHIDADGLFRPDGTVRTIFKSQKRGWDDVVLFLNSLSKEVKQYVLNPATPSKKHW